MSRFASQTSVSAANSKAEIEKMLTRYGANSFVSGWQGDTAVIGFTFADRTIRFELRMPPKDSKEFTLTPAGRKRRDPQDVLVVWEQATRQRWRALALVIKAKLEAVECKISSFEDEFLAHVVMAGGQTVGGWIGPQLDQMYKTKTMPRLLPGLGESGK